MRRMVHEITSADVGSSHIGIQCPTCGHRTAIPVSGFMGPIQAQDVGKRIYDVDGVYQVENNQQRDARVAGGGA